MIGLRPSPLRLIPLSLLLFFSLATHAYATSKDCIHKQLFQNDANLIGNRFMTDRTLSDYMEFLGRDFVRELQGLPENSHWMDAGAGQARVFLGATQPHMNIKTQNLTAVVHTRVEGALTEIPQRNYRYLEGRYIEDIPNSEIGALDVITDVFGPFSYTAAPDVILKKYLELLNVGKSAHLYLKGEPYLVIDGVQAGIENWLHSIQGAKITVTRSPSSKFSTNSAIKIHITKLSETTEVPKLYLNSFDASRPPIRSLHR